MEAIQIAPPNGRLLLATEIGGGYGHLLPWRKSLTDLIDQGKSVVVACDDPQRGAALIGDARVVFVAAPRRQGVMDQRFADPQSWPELMLSLGYGDREQVLAMLNGWIETMLTHRTDNVIADHAPVAMLAAKALRLGVTEASSGFCVPPTSTPMPRFVGNDVATEKSRTELEAQLVSSWRWAMAQAKAGAGLFEPSTIQKLFQGHPRYVTSIAALDPYAPRTDVLYTGPLQVDLAGQKITPADAWWVAREGQVLVYLKLSTPGLKTLMRALQQSGQRVLAVVPGIGPDREVNRNMFLTGSPVNLATLLPSATLLVTNGGNHCVGMAIEQQVRVVCVPMQPEQALTAISVSKSTQGYYWMEGLHPVSAFSAMLAMPALNLQATSHKHRSYP